MFEKILFPVDGTLEVEERLPHLISIAQAYDAQVVLLHIPFSSAETHDSRSVDAWDWQIRQAEAEAYLNELSARLEKAGLKIQADRLAGKLPEHSLEREDYKNTDLILLSHTGRGGPNAKALSGPVLDLIQRTQASVMIVHSSQPLVEEATPMRYRNILAPLDGSQRAEYGLSVAAHLARAHQANLLLAHVIKPPEMPRKMPLTNSERRLVNGVVESNQAEATSYLNQLKDALGGRVKTYITINQRVADTLHSLIEHENVDLVVLNAHGLGGDPQWPYGSITANFLANTGIPLMVVQDFTRDRNVQAGMGLQEETGYARPFLNPSGELFWEMRG